MRRRICEAAERGADLEAKRFALEEIRDGLEVNVCELRARVSAVEREQTDLRSQIDERTRRVGEIEAEIDATQIEVTLLERQCAANLRKAARISRRAEALTGEMRASQGTISASEVTLEVVRDSVARMDRKLGSTGRGRAQSDAD